jgi:hypothetical protein
MGTLMMQIELMRTGFILLPAFVFHGIACCVTLFRVLFFAQQTSPRPSPKREGHPCTALAFKLFIIVIIISFGRIRV